MRLLDTALLLNHLPYILPTYVCSHLAYMCNHVSTLLHDLTRVFCKLRLAALGGL